MSQTNRRWILATAFAVVAWAIVFPAMPAWAQTQAFDPPTITCNGSTDTTITIRVCGGATTGAPAGFSLQWVPSGTVFDGNTCSASFSGVPSGSTFDLGPGEC